MGPIAIEATVDAEALAPELLALVQAAFEGLRGRLEPESSALRETLGTIRDKARREAVALARLDGRLAGCAFYRREGDDLYIGKLAVRPEQRRRGIAGRLIGFVEQQAALQGCARVTLEVRIALPDNIRLFESHGFRAYATGSYEGFAQPTYLKMAKAAGVTGAAAL